MMKRALFFQLPILIILVLGGFSASFGGAPADPHDEKNWASPWDKSATIAYTVEKARNQPQFGMVMLTGRIVKRVPGEKYMYIFKDATGEMRVYIRRKVMKKRDIYKYSQVRLYGLMEQRGQEPEMIVNSMETTRF